MIRQLGSLSTHAEDLFSQIIREIEKVSQKADSLYSRIKEAANRVSQLNALEEQGESLPMGDCIVKSMKLHSVLRFYQFIGTE